MFVVAQRTATPQSACRQQQLARTTSRNQDAAAARQRDRAAKQQPQQPHLHPLHCMFLAALALKCASKQVKISTTTRAQHDFQACHCTEAGTAAAAVHLLRCLLLLFLVFLTLLYLCLQCAGSTHHSRIFMHQTLCQILKQPKIVQSQRPDVGQTFFRLAGRRRRRRRRTNGEECELSRTNLADFGIQLLT